VLGFGAERRKSEAYREALSAEMRRHQLKRAYLKLQHSEIMEPLKTFLLENLAHELDYN
jgi:hypothetical protein